MKVTSRQLAEVLLVNTFYKEREEVDDYVRVFSKYLIKSRKYVEYPSIIREYTHLYEQKSRIIEVVATVKYKLTSIKKIALKKLLRNFCNESYQFNIVEKVDKSIIGGVSLEFSDKRINATLNRQLSKLAKIFANHEVGSY